MKTTHDNDERGGVPSASGAEALMLCAGKWRMEQNCGIPSETSAVANRGTAIHLAIESGTTEGLNGEDSAEAQKLALAERDAVSAWLEDIGQETVAETVREERLWLTNAKGEQVFSGKPDAIHRAGDALLVVDYKTGWNPYDPAETNVQLACNALLAARHFGVKTVRVVLIQARFGVSQADHDEDSLNQIERRIRGMLVRIDEDNSELRAGDKQCRYCRAFGICPEVRSQTLDAMRSRTLSVVPSGTELRAYAIIEKLIGERRRLAKLAMGKGVEIEGWALANGRRTVKVTNPSEAFARVAPVIEPEAFAACCDVSVPKVAELYAKSTGLAKKTARENLEQLWDGLIAENVGEPILKQQKGAV
jgi:RecB family exonuclease